ncbi:hypothetical protein Hdeb2414_s0007g00225731 [Helianthus debilis subsp. tardiflorus]
MNGGGLGGIGIMGGLGGAGGLQFAGSPAVSVSPVPYVLNGVFRGRKNGAIEKVVERR